MSLIDEFDKNTRARVNNGRHTIRCRLGLWVVDAPTLKEARREAMHYFLQYYKDGEYETKEHKRGSTNG